MSDRIELEPEVLDALRKNRKIEAIKLIRESRGIGLKEAKELVASIDDGYPKGNGEVELKGQAVQEVKSTNAWISIVALAIIGYLGYRFLG